MPLATRDRTAADAVNSDRRPRRARQSPARWTRLRVQVPGRGAMLRAWLSLWVGGPERGREAGPAVAAEGQHRALRGLAVADLESFPAPRPALHAVAPGGG